MTLASAAAVAIYYRQSRKPVAGSPLFSAIPDTSPVLDTITLSAPRNNTQPLPIAKPVFKETTVHSTSGSRGVTNNNPGNIRKSKDAWQGLAAKQTDLAFFVFTEPKWGVRALGHILLNYYRKYNLRTISAIIARWAPSVENPTIGYAAYVANSVGVSPSAVLDVPAKLGNIVYAIIRFENGFNPYSLDDVKQWVNLP